MAELWDAYDSTFHKIETMTLLRGEPLPDGIYHLVCDIIVKHIDGNYLLMRRDHRKPYGGMWELTADCSALQGEAPLDCARRELREETGVTAVNLKEIGRIIHDAHHALYVEYLCITDCPKDSILLQEGETIAYKWVDRTTLLEIDSRELAPNRSMKLIRELDL